MKGLFSVILVLILGCNSPTSNDTLTGDLYFSPFRVGGYYNQPDSVVKQYEDYLNNLSAEENAGLSKKKVLQRVKLLKEKNLLYHPFVYLRTKKDSIITLYLDTADYNQIKIYKRQKLRDENKKVRIQASVSKIDSGMYHCRKLKRIDLVDGETLLEEKKFKIEDYN